jgi:hypothetical protein
VSSRIERIHADCYNRGCSTRSPALLTARDTGKSAKIWRAHDVLRSGSLGVAR